jgi:hypothetical protein
MTEGGAAACASPATTPAPIAIANPAAKPRRTFPDFLVIFLSLLQTLEFESDEN